MNGDKWGEINASWLSQVNHFGMWEVLCVEAECGVTLVGRLEVGNLDG